MDRFSIPIKLLPHAEGLPLPVYATEGASGMDLYAACPLGKPVTLAPMQRALVPAGFSMELPQGAEAQIRPRSGLALKHGVSVLNAPGTIDSDYRGEVCVILINLSEDIFTVERGLRMAQMVIQKTIRAQLTPADELSQSVRDAGGFGSTGF